MRIKVAGQSGRMGRLVIELLPAFGVLLAAADEPADVLIDFTHADAVPAHAALVRQAGMAWVLGTTGLSPQAEALVRAAAQDVAVVWAANFSAGVTLLLAVATRLARALPGETYDAEICEMHHRFKRDAPSGTALALGHAVASGRGVPLAATRARDSARDGDTGARVPGSVGFAALRGGQVVGEHTLLFAGDSEHLSITHKALDRRVFAEGALRAAAWTQGRAPGLYGMGDVLGLGEA